MFKFLSCINPKPPPLSCLVQALPQLEKFVDKKLLDEEWRAHYLEEDLSAHLKVTEYWDIVFKKRNAADLPSFPNLTVAISTVLSLPFSNASVERFFSHLNLTKTSQRSSLKNETLRGLMHAVFYLKNKVQSAHNIVIDEHLLRAINNVKSNATCSEEVNVYKPNN